MAKISPERVINITCQITSAAAPIFSLGPLGIPLGIVSAAGLELAMVNTRSAHANVRFNGRLMVWAVRIFVCILEQMAYQAVAIFWVSGGEGRTLPLGLNAMYFAWAVVCFMALVDLGAYLSNSVKAAAVAADQEHAATLERADALERERAERKANEEREKREHEARLAQIAADTAKAQAEAAARAQAEAARAQAEAQAEAARAQAEAVRIKAEADRKREEDKRNREEDARKVAEAAAEARRRQAEEAEARRNAQIVEQQRLAQQKAAQEQREREAAEAANRKREQEEAEARAASDAKRNRFRLSTSASERWDTIVKAEAHLTSALGRKPTQKQIAEEVGTSERTVREYQAKFQRAAQAA